MTIRKIHAPDEGRVTRWLVEEGQAVEAGTPLAILDIKGESRQIRSGYRGLVKAIKLANNATFAAHVTLAVLDILRTKNPDRSEDAVADNHLIDEIEGIVERVVAPHFKEVADRFTGIEATLARIEESTTKKPKSPKSNKP